MASLTSTAAFTALPRRSRRAGRCVCAAAVPPSVAAPPQLVAPAPARSTAAWPELSVSAPSPLWTVADAAVVVAPAPAAAAPAATESGLPEGSSWRYSEFINAVQKGKVERVRFAKDGSALQLTAVDGCVATRPACLWCGPGQTLCGAPSRRLPALLLRRPSPPPDAVTPLPPPARRRATVVLPNDPDLVDILAKNGVDISVSEGDTQGNTVALLGNLLFPVLALGGLFFLFQRAQARAKPPF